VEGEPTPGPVLRQAQGWTGWLLPLAAQGGPLLTLFSWAIGALIIYALMLDRSRVQDHNYQLYTQVLGSKTEVVRLLERVLQHCPGLKEEHP
jgi:hypothetical protein